MGRFRNTFTFISIRCLNSKNLYKLCNRRIECFWSENVDSLSKDDIFNLIKPKDFILVKGSRNMKMEIIVKYLLDNFKGK